MKFLRCATINLLTGLLLIYALSWREMVVNGMLTGNWFKNLILSVTYFVSYGIPSVLPQLVIWVAFGCLVCGIWRLAIRLRARWKRSTGSNE